MCVYMKMPIVWKLSLGLFAALILSTSPAHACSGYAVEDLSPLASTGSGATCEEARAELDSIIDIRIALHRHLNALRCLEWCASQDRCIAVDADVLERENTDRVCDGPTFRVRYNEQGRKIDSQGPLYTIGKVTRYKSL